MQTYESLKHTVWECKYHVVFIPKYRRKAIIIHQARQRPEVLPILDLGSNVGGKGQRHGAVTTVTGFSSG